MNLRLDLCAAAPGSELLKARNRKTPPYGPHPIQNSNPI